MCIFVCFNKFQGAQEMVDAVQEMVDGSRFRRTRRRLVSKFSSVRQTSPPLYELKASFLDLNPIFRR